MGCGYWLFVCNNLSIKRNVSFPFILRSYTDPVIKN